MFLIKFIKIDLNLQLNLVLHFASTQEIIPVLSIIFIQDISQQMYDSIQRYVPLFENYLKADNQQDFIKNLHDPIEKKIIQLLTNDISSVREYRKQLGEVRIYSAFERDLLTHKLTNYLQKIQELKDDEIGLEIKKAFANNRFDYPRPQTMSANDPTGQKQDLTPTKLKVQENLQKYLNEKLTQNPNFIRNLNDYGISKVSKKVLLGLPLTEQEYLLQKCGIFYHFDENFTADFLIAYEKQKRKNNQSYRLTSKILENLTKLQINHLGSVDKKMYENEDYIELWFNLNFSQRITKHIENSQEYTKQEHLNKREDFLRIIQELNGQNHNIIRSYITKFKAEVMLIDTIVNDPSIERLIEYLKTNKSALSINELTNDYRNQSQQRIKNDSVARMQPKMRYTLSVDKTPADQLVNDYLEKLFRNSKDGLLLIQKLEPFINRRYLLRTHARARLSLGEHADNIHQLFENEELTKIKEEKSIKFHTTNKKNFRPNDEVQLEVSIKNVERIDFKIYELSLQKHLLTSDNKQIDDEINLSFLKPEVEYIYLNDVAKTNPFAVVNTTLKIDTKHIPKRMGVFIVDLQGDTVTSRAVIRKGAILCLESLTQAGQQFSFYDQEGRPLTQNDGLKVWANGKPTALKENKNYFFVNYVQKKGWIQIVASVGSYAESFQKELKPEQYKFEVGYIYNNQSFIVGKKAKVGLHGRLTMNNYSMSLQLLQNIKVKVIVTNNQKIATFYSFNIDKWSDRQDQFIQFPIQSYTSSINISVEAKVMLQTKKETTVSHSKDIQIDLSEGTQNFIDIYLEKDRQSNYILNLLGLNGETITNSDVILTYSINGVEQVEKTKVKTDQYGKVHLGKLSIVKELTAEANCYQATVERSWRLDKAELGVNYTNVIHVKVGQEITLPADSTWTHQDYVLLRTFDKFYAEDISSQIKIQKSRITLPIIKNEGYYILKILPIDKTIQIITLKDYKWEGDTDQNQKVYDQNCAKIYDINRNVYQNVNILEVRQEKLENTTKMQVTLNLQGLKEQKYKNVRIHAFATNFVPNQTHQVFKSQDFNVQPQLNQYYMRFKSSAYYSNKTLSDEGAYVWKRQKQNERIIGNNLQKPGIFLKRALVRQTNQQNEDLSDQERYIEECALSSVNPNLRQRVNPKKDKKAYPKPKTTCMNSHNNFLSLSGHVEYNLNGQTVTFEVPNNYNNVELLILTPTTSIIRNISLGNTQHKKNKDLRHVGMVDSQKTKGWTMSRQVYQLPTGKEMIINRNSLWRTVTLSNIFEFANAKRISMHEWNSHILGWNIYDEKKKKQIYDKETCHQLNVFLFFQDRKFFEEVVKPFICNKINKTFIDLCLIGDENIREFASLHRLSKLNAFQKVMLVHSLVAQKQNEIAQKITKMLSLEQDSIKRNYEQFKNNFDIIINAKEPQKQAKEKYKMESLSRRRAQPQMKNRGMCEEEQQDYQDESCIRAESYSSHLYERNQRMVMQKKAFVPIESTKEYTQRTYYSVKNYKIEAPYLVNGSPFWAKLAEHFLTGKQTQFLSKQFMTLNTGIEFILAGCFISSESSANFDLEVVGENYKITARSPMLLYVKQVKQLEYASKFGVQINQRFIDPLNMHTYEDGLRIEKQVEEFVVKKPYIAQTVVTNTSGTPLELQILLDIPKGTIPLQSHQYTEIQNIVLKEYTSKEFKRIFYAPQEGKFRIYPSNACRGSTIIAKAQPKPDIIVKKYLTINKYESFTDILRSGDKQKIVEFLHTKNIFDSNVFDPISILWMLKDKEFYHAVVSILRERRYYNYDIWNFAFYHNDLLTIREAVNFGNGSQQSLEPAVFEYFPYYSSRTHLFANQTKSTIRNVQFKESYHKFLMSSVIGIDQKAAFYVTFAYYLILQDRLKEADAILNRIVKQFPKSHQVQVDYMRCFLDISLNPPNFEVARQVVQKYKDYPIQSWKKLFDEVRKSLEAQDQDFYQENEFKRAEEFQTQVIQETGQFKIIQPHDTIILVQFFEINLEVFFSEYPFYDYKSFTAVKPSHSKEFPANSETKQIIIKRKDYPGIRDATIEITEIKEGLPPKKVSTFEWANSQLKVKVSENSGTLQVFLNKKKHAGAYVKVFSKKSYMQQFYRDGYTDMTGSFRYAMSDLQGISEFSILVSTDKGGIIQKVKPPSKLASY